MYFVEARYHWRWNIKAPFPTLKGSSQGLGLKCSADLPSCHGTASPPIQTQRKGFVPTLMWLLVQKRLCSDFQQCGGVGVREGGGNQKSGSKKGQVKPIEGCTCCTASSVRERLSWESSHRTETSVSFPFFEELSACLSLRIYIMWLLVYWRISAYHVTGVRSILSINKKAFVGEVQY